MDPARLPLGPVPHRPSPAASPPSMYTQPFTPSEPGTDEFAHFSAHPPSPAHPAEFPCLEPLHPSYPSSPVFPPGVSLPAFSCPAPPEPRDPAFFNDRNFWSPLAQPLHHPWACYPPTTYQNEPSGVLQQNPATFYPSPYLPPTTFTPTFPYPAPEELFGQSTDIDNFKQPILLPNYNIDLTLQTTNIHHHRQCQPILLTPSPPPSPFLPTTTTGTTMTHQNKRKLTTKPPPIPRSKKKKSSKLSGTQRICKGCGATDTPEWRSGPSGERDFCNACGLRWKKALKSGKVGKVCGGGGVFNGVGVGKLESGFVSGVGNVEFDRSINIKVENV